MGATNFVGTWRFVSAVSTRSNGERTYPFGPDAAGVIIWDALGNFAAQIIRRDTPRFASGGLRTATPDEVQRAYAGVVAYFGTYEVDEPSSVVTHHVEASWNPNMVGVDQLRRFQFSEDRLTLSPPPQTVDGDTITTFITWERARPA